MQQNSYTDETATDSRRGQTVGSKRSRRAAVVVVLALFLGRGFYRIELETICKGRMREVSQALRQELRDPCPHTIEVLGREGDDWPAPAELVVPSRMVELPQCPKGGVFSLKESAVVYCSQHGRLGRSCGNVFWDERVAYYVHMFFW